MGYFVKSMMTATAITMMQRTDTARLIVSMVFLLRVIIALADCAKQKESLYGFEPLLPLGIAP